MYPITNTKKAGARFVAAAVLAMAAAACQSPDVVNVCNDRPECYRSDAPSDGPRADTRPASDAPEGGQPRNPLCGNMGCLPGNWNACGTPSPQPLTAATAMHQDDAASDATSETDVTVGVDASSDVTADAPSDAGSSSDAQGDSCRDAHSDGSSPPTDVSLPDAGTIDVSAPDVPPVDDGSSPPTDDAAPDGLPPPTDASVPMDAGRADVRPDLGTEEPPIVRACYINPGPTGVTTECAPAGTRDKGEPCNDSHECGPLFACVEAENKATCQEVSCSTPSCLKWTYYREVPLRANGVTRSDLLIPVCYPTDNCTLLAQGQCAEGKVCAVVGTFGDTNCTEPGTAMAGESCSDTHTCAEGLLCSKVVGQCIKICRDNPDSQDCPNGGICQAGNLSLPSGFGVCVGQVDGG